MSYLRALTTPRDDIDFEVYNGGPGPYRWQAYRGSELLDAGSARTHLGLALTVWRRALAYRLRRPDAS